LRAENPDMKVARIRSKCIKAGFDKDQLPPDPDSFRRWLNRERKE
jgi:hypothetical protein